MGTVSDVGRALWVSFCLVAVILAVYAQVGQHSFLNYDDPAYVTENPHVKDGLTAKSLHWAFATTHAANWHPITWISHMLDVQLYGLKPGGHHLTNVFFHILSTLLLLKVFHHMTGQLWPSSFVAALFALHPLHVESVAWVAERKDVLSAFFWMLTMWAYARYAAIPNIRRYIAVLLFFVLGLLAKPMAVTLPFVLLLLDFWPLGRVGFHGSCAVETVTIRDLFLEKIPLMFFSALSGAITFYVQRNFGAVSTLDVAPLPGRMINALVSYAAYIGKMFWPTDLAVVYPYPDTFPLWLVAVPFLVIGALSVLAIVTVRRHPYLLVGWLWYLGTLVPVIGLVQVGLQSMACRYTYIPLIGLFIMVAFGYSSLLSGLQKFRLAIMLLPVLVVVGCAMVTWWHLYAWKDSVTLFRHALSVTRGNYVAHTNLGLALAERGQMEEAIAHYYAALRIHPNFEEARIKFGPLLLNLGRDDEAIDNYSKISGHYTDYDSVQFNLGNAFLRRNDIDGAMEHYAKALEANPDFAEAHNNLGMALILRNQLDQAIEHFKKALQIKADFADAENNLQRALEIKNSSKGPGDGGSRSY